jgi:hypothetical protein
MADSKIGVGGTIGIVVGITAVLGLGLYLILKPKASNVQPNYVPPPTSDAELRALKAQLAALQQQQAKGNIPPEKRDDTDAQIKGIAIALGGKLASSALDSWISGWGKGSNVNENVKSGSFDYTNADQGLIDDYVYNYGDI